MHSVVIRRPFEVEIVDDDLPKAGAGDIVVEAELSGISSGTEMFLYRGTVMVNNTLNILPLPDLPQRVQSPQRNNRKTQQTWRAQRRNTLADCLTFC